MNEKYFTQFKRSPDSQFIEKVRMRLEKKERTQRIKRYSFLSVLALTFVFGMLMIFSSTVRAEVISILTKIGSVQYEVTSQYPGNPDEPEVELAPEHLLWDKARSHFLSTLELPTYAPAGYKREADVEFYIWGDNSPMLQTVWRKKGAFALIGLMINQCTADAQGCGMTVGTGGLAEITINGKPAALIRGGWNSGTRQYDLSHNINIVWRYDENTVYQLWSGDQNLVDELIKMAESIP
jgi:hypothetical protein